MVGCMVATSLAMAPAMLLAQTARFVDLDGPLLLAKDRARRAALRATAWFIRPRRRCGAEFAPRLIARQTRPRDAARIEDDRATA